MNTNYSNQTTKRQIDNSEDISTKKTKPNTIFSFPNDILLEIFQYISCESTKNNILLANKNFRLQFLRCSPSKNIHNMAFTLLNYGYCDTPPLIIGEKLPLFTSSDLDNITQFSDENPKLLHDFLISNKKLDTKLAKQIIRCSSWKFEDIEPYIKLEGSEKFVLTDLAKLCRQILDYQNYENQVKEEINKNELLATAVFYTNYKDKDLSKHYSEKRKEDDKSSKISMLVPFFADFDEGVPPRFANTPLNKDKEVVQATLNWDCKAFKYADDILKKDREFVLEALSITKKVLKHADDSLKKDREIVLEAVKKDGYSLKYADDILKKDREFVLEAVRVYGMALLDADDSLKNDKEIILEALKNDISMLRMIDDSLRKNRELALEAIKIDPIAIMYTHDSLKEDKEFVLAAAKINVSVIEYLEDCKRLKIGMTPINHF